MRMASTRPVALILGLAAGVGALVLAGRTDQPELPRAIGWALLAATVASLAFGHRGRQVLGGLVVVLGLGLAWPAAHPGLVISGIAAIIAGGIFLAHAGRWDATRRFDRETPTVLDSDTDVWKAMDAGLDPTADGFGDNLASQARMVTPAPSKIQEDQ